MSDLRKRELEAQALDAIASDSLRNVGAALAEYRQRHRLTLQDVSNITGVSVGSLSKIENGKAEPSFRTLMRIVQSLNLGSTPKTAAVRATAIGRKTVTLTGEALVSTSTKAIMHIHALELLNKEMFPMVAQITLRSVPPFEEWTRHEGDEFVYVLSGSIDVYAEHYRPYVLEQGESTYYDSGMRHVLVSRGEADAMVLSVSTSRLSDDATETASL